jgi:hypothetical protein
MEITHPRHWRLERIQGRFCWLLSFTHSERWLNFHRIGWR